MPIREVCLTCKSSITFSPTLDGYRHDDGAEDDHEVVHALDVDQGDHSA